MFYLILIAFLTVILIAWALSAFGGTTASGRHTNSNARPGIRIPCNSYTLPEIPKQWSVCTDIEDVTYIEAGFTINPHRMTCNCNEFTVKRENYETLDIRRLCHHLQKYFYTSDISNVINSKILHIIKDRLQDDNYLEATIDDTPVVIGWCDNQKWVSIFTGEPDSPVRYGLNTKTLEWSFGAKPGGLDITRSKADRIQSLVEKSSGSTLYLPRRLSPKDEEITLSSTLCKPIHYSVNLFDMTCTCPDFTSNKQSRERLDIRRMCRHITDAYTASGLIDNCSMKIQSLVLVGGRNECYFETDISDRRVVVGWDPGNKWITVFFPNNDNDGSKQYERYSFNIDRNQWSHSYPLKKYAHPAKAVFREIFHT